MKKERKKIRKSITAVIPAFMLLGVMLIPAKTVWAENTDYGKQLETGTCGAEGNEDGITWTVYDSGADGDENKDTGDTLVFSGSGEMADYSYFYQYFKPWGGV